MEFPLPPLDEQRRIAGILDAADALRAKRRQALAKLYTLTKSIFIDMFGGGGRAPVLPRSESGTNPQSLRWVPIRDVATMGTGHTPDRERPDYWNGGISWINLTEIRRLSGTVCWSTELQVSQAGIDNSSAVVHPAGTVCFSRTASIGFVTVMGVPMATSQDFVTWTCGEALDPMYLMHALLNSRETLRSSSSGSTHKTIYVRDAERFSVLLPPIEQQREFGSRIHEIASTAERMWPSGARLDVLFASLQQRAFRGEL